VGELPLQPRLFGLLEGHDLRPFYVHQVGPTFLGTDHHLAHRLLVDLGPRPDVPAVAVVGPEHELAEPPLVAHGDDFGTPYPSPPVHSPRRVSPQRNTVTSGSLRYAKGRSRFYSRGLCRILQTRRTMQPSCQRFVAPTRLTYLSSETGVDADKATGIVRRVTELRASDSSRFPGEGASGTR